DGFVITVRGDRRERDLRRSGVGPQPKIGAEDVAVRRPLFEQQHEIARQTNEKRLQISGSRETGFLAIEKDDQIDVARIVEFECSELTHGEDEVAGPLLRRRGIGRLPDALPGGLAKKK